MRFYIKANGKLTKKTANMVSANNGNIALDLAGMGFKALREALGADKNSPIMAIVK